MLLAVLVLTGGKREDHPASSAPPKGDSIQLNPVVQVAGYPALKSFKSRIGICRNEPNVVNPNSVSHVVIPFHRLRVFCQSIAIRFGLCVPVLSQVSPFTPLSNKQTEPDVSRLFLSRVGIGMKGGKGDKSILLLLYLCSFHLSPSFLSFHLYGSILPVHVSPFTPSFTPPFTP